MAGSSKRFARRVALPVLARVNPGDVTITHHWTGRPFRVHSFRHKGYWYHRGNRERESMLMSARLLGPGDVVVEVGAHVGYLAEFFAEMVGPAGRLDVYEPAPENLRYLRRNLEGRDNVSIVAVALSDEIGFASFFVEDLSGQNNSLVADYEVLEGNQERAGVRAHLTEIRVPTDTIDNRYLDTDRLDFIKIDVEGAELQVLQGASQVLAKFHPIVFVEISLNHEQTREFLRGQGYRLFAPNGTEETEASGLENHFALHREAHAELIRGLGATSPESG